MKLIYLIGEITFDTMKIISLFIKNNIKNFATILELLLPFVMYVIGQKVAGDKITIGIEILIPVIVSIISYYSRQVANKIGKGCSIPVPIKRFTEEDDYGEITIETNRLQELIIYTNDVENWLTKKGLL